jgi:hypothetical protein
MNPEIERLLDEIGREAAAAAVHLNGKLLVYAEADDGVVSADLFYEKGTTKVVTFKYCPDTLCDLVLNLWEKWRDHPGSQEWGAMAYVLQNRKFTLDLTYRDQMKANEETSDRRPWSVQKHFGDIQVDYSQPDL